MAGFRSRRGVLAMFFAAVINVAGIVAGEAAPTATPTAAAAAAEREVALREVRALREKARARGERILWKEFAQPATPEGVAAYQFLLSWAKNQGQPPENLPENEKEAFEAASMFMDGLTKDSMVKLENYRFHLAALPQPPLEALAEDYAVLDQILAGPRPVFAIDPENMLQPGELTNLEHLRILRHAARRVAGRVRVVAATRGGDDALETLARDVSIENLVEGDRTLIHLLVRAAIRAIICRSLNDAILLDHPSPVALREWADRLEALPSLHGVLRESCTFERAWFERFFFLDEDWTVREPKPSLWVDKLPLFMGQGEIAFNDLFPPADVPGREELVWNALNTVPALRPERQILQIYLAYEYLLGGPVLGAITYEDVDIIEEIRRLCSGQIEAAKKKVGFFQRTPDFSRVGADLPSAALIALGFLPSTRPAEMVGRDGATRTALAYLLRKFAARLEGIAYQWDDIPVNRLTGEPFRLERENGLAYLYVLGEGGERTGAKIFYCVPLAEGDVDYDPANPWRHGFAPPAPPPEPLPEPPAPSPPPEPLAEPPDVF